MPPAVPVPVAERVTRHLAAGLGPDLLAVYLHGSAVGGGLRHDSDVDLLAVVARTLASGTRRDLVRFLMGVSGRRATEGPARPVELTVVVRDDVVPWRYPPRHDLQYGEWLRDDLVRELPRPAPDPDLAVLLFALRSQSLSLLGPPAHELLDAVPPEDLRRAFADGLDPLLRYLRGDERNVLLTLARMWVTATGGEVVAKDVAARAVAVHLPPADRQTLALAAAAYRGEAAGDWSVRRQEAADAATLLAGLVRAALASTPQPRGGEHPRPDQS
jgi:aminoglycoside 9-adenylyltransferase